MDKNDYFPLNIKLRKDPIFREKITPKIEVPKVGFSEEFDNPNNFDRECGDKIISLFNDATKEHVGSINYDYVAADKLNQFIKVRSVAIDERYRGQDLGVTLYENLIKLAKDKKLNGISSDSVVQAGALITWKKLIDKGYSIHINTEAQSRWEDFLNTYNEGKFFKDSVRVEKGASVFELVL